MRPGPGCRFPPGSVASRCWTVFSLRVRRTRIADIASDTPQICGSPRGDDDRNTRRASLEFVCVFGRDGRRPALGDVVAVRVLAQDGYGATDHGRSKPCKSTLDRLFAEHTGQSPSSYPVTVPHSVQLRRCPKPILSHTPDRLGHAVAGDDYWAYGTQSPCWIFVSASLAASAKEPVQCCVSFIIIIVGCTFYLFIRPRRKHRH